MHFVHFSMHLFNSVRHSCKTWELHLPCLHSSAHLPELAMHTWQASMHSRHAVLHFSSLHTFKCSLHFAMQILHASMLSLHFFAQLLNITSVLQVSLASLDPEPEQQSFNSLHSLVHSLHLFMQFLQASICPRISFLLFLLKYFYKIVSGFIKINYESICASKIKLILLCCMCFKSGCERGVVQ